MNLVEALDHIRVHGGFIYQAGDPNSFLTFIRLEGVVELAQYSKIRLRGGMQDSYLLMSPNGTSHGDLVRVHNGQIRPVNDFKVSSMLAEWIVTPTMQTEEEVG